MMQHFAVVDESGYVSATGHSNVLPEGAVELDAPLVLPPLLPGFRYHLATNSVVDTRTLDDRKTQKWVEIRGARDAAEFGGFTWDGSTFDSDATSQSRIMGAAQLAQLDPTFTVDWTLADNSVRTLSADDMVAVGVALGQHVATQHATARTLRAQIQAAATAAEVAAVVWPS